MTKYVCNGLNSSNSSSGSNGISGMQVYSTPGSYTWTCPSNVYNLTVECWGAGGAGTGLSYGVGYIGTGGGAGGYAKSHLQLIPGNTYTIIVGSRGTTNNIVNYYNGLQGSLSSFNSSVIAYGGKGGNYFLQDTGVKNGGEGGDGVGQYILKGSQFYVWIDGSGYYNTGARANAPYGGLGGHDGILPTSPGGGGDVGQSGADGTVIITY